VGLTVTDTVTGVTSDAVSTVQIADPSAQPTLAPGGLSVTIRSSRLNDVAPADMNFSSSVAGGT
jgi:hypothetical protein